jgi:hypothetical protein
MVEHIWGLLYPKYVGGIGRRSAIPGWPEQKGRLYLKSILKQKRLEA